MSQQYVLTRPYKHFQTGYVLEPGALVGDGLVRQGGAIKVAPREVATSAPPLVPGGLPFFPDAELKKLMIARGLMAGEPDRKVSKTTIQRR